MSDTPNLSPRGQAMVDLIVARDQQIAGLRTGQVLFDLGLTEVHLKIQEVLPPVKVFPATHAIAIIDPSQRPEHL